jgi:hypothetical protein
MSKQQVLKFFLVALIMLTSAICGVVVAAVETPEVSTEYLAGPVSAGQSQMAVVSLSMVSEYQGRQAPPGMQIFRVDYRFFNLAELRPLETDIAALSTLVEEGAYLYQPLSAPKKGEARNVRRYYALEPVADSMFFEVPDQHGDLELLHFTGAGIIRLDLTPDRPAQRLPEPIAGPTQGGKISISIYGLRPSAGDTGLIIDLGLGLNSGDLMTDLPIDLSQAFELHEASGDFYRADPSLEGMRRPLGHVVLRRDQVARGEVAFRGAVRGSGQSLLLPLVSGPVRLDVPGGQ